MGQRPSIGVEKHHQVSEPYIEGRRPTRNTGSGDFFKIHFVANFSILDHINS